MQLNFLIDNNPPDPKLGIVEGYIHEAINQISVMELFVVSDIDMTEEECEAMLGKRATVSLGDVVDGELLWSRFDGVIYEFHIPDVDIVQDNWFPYTIVIRPLLWQLNFEARSKSFVDKTRIEVIDEVLKVANVRKDVDYQAKYFDESVYLKLKQILQYETSDLQFLQQLMQEGGINYFFSASKDGESEESLKLIDNNAFFSKAYDGAIPWISAGAGRGLAIDDRNISSFVTHIRTTPSAVQSTLNLGDGVPTPFEGSRDVQKGVGGTYRIFGCEGQEKSAVQAATVLSQAIEAGRVSYEGESNHFLIRAGEKIFVQGDSLEREKEVLITSVQHRFSVGVGAAEGAGEDPDYSNRFVAVQKSAEVRPMQLRGERLVGMWGSQREPASDHLFSVLEKTLKEQIDPKITLKPSRVPQVDLQRALLAIVDQLTKARDLAGVMIGNVTEDAKISEGNELVCQLETERFPDGLTAKIALGWLTENQGWASFLPRVGMQVYFIVAQGTGGQNEAVIIGYRPTATVKTLDPAKTTETKKLTAKTPPELGSEATEVVVGATYAPQNRQRNTILGEGAVAEVAVIDGGEDSVAIHANKGVHITGDAEIHLSGESQCQMAETLAQQFGSVDRGVVGDQRESIGGNHEMTVMADQSVQIAGNKREDVQGNIDFKNENSTTIRLQNGDDTKLELIENKEVRLVTAGNNLLSIQNSGASSLETEKEIKLSAGDKATINVLGEDETLALETGQSKMEITADGVAIETADLEIKVGGATLTMKQSGQVELKGAAQVTIKGGMVQIN